LPAVIFGLATAESLQLRRGQLFVNPYINPKLIFMTLSPSIYAISMLVPHFGLAFSQPDMHSFKQTVTVFGLEYQYPVPSRRF